MRHAMPRHATTRPSRLRAVLIDLIFRARSFMPLSCNLLSPCNNHFGTLVFALQAWILLGSRLPFYRLDLAVRLVHPIRRCRNPPLKP